MQLEKRDSNYFLQIDDSAAYAHSAVTFDDIQPRTKEEPHVYSTRDVDRERGQEIAADIITPPQADLPYENPVDQEHNDQHLESDAESTVSPPNPDNPPVPEVNELPADDLSFLNTSNESQHKIDKTLEAANQSGINVKETVDTLLALEQDHRLIQPIDMQMVVGSGAATLSGLLTPGTRAIKDLDLITFVQDEGTRQKLVDLTEAAREDLHICRETNEIYDSTQFRPNPQYNAEDIRDFYLGPIMPWSRPYVLRLTDDFREGILHPVAHTLLDKEVLELLPDDYLMATIGIGTKLERDFKQSDVAHIRDLVDTATGYKMSYYQNRHTDPYVKSNISLPTALQRILFKKL